MALPTQIKTALDRLYDFIQSGKAYTTEKLTIGAKTYKLRMYKPSDDSDALLVIELVDRTPTEE